jgi:SnoaL-like protein
MSRGSTAHRSGMLDAEMEALLKFYAPDVICYPDPGWVDDAVCHGHDGMRRLIRRFTAKVDDFDLAVHEVRDLGERMLVLAEFKGRLKGSGLPARQSFGIVNSSLSEEGKVGVAHFFLRWEDARRAAGIGS